MLSRAKMLDTHIMPP